MKCIAVISCFFFGQLSVSFLGPCCLAPLYCTAVHDCLMLIEQINDDDDKCVSLVFASGRRAGYTLGFPRISSFILFYK